MQEKITFGKFIAKKRKDSGLTQKELAEKLFVTESAVSKWERGISYPDITLVSPICEQLGISEHELISAGDDYEQREIERQAKSFRHIHLVYSWIFFIGYALTLIITFICNLTTDKTLSWFFIVLTSVMTAFSLTSVPVLVKNNKALITLFSFYVSLNLLLLTCSLLYGGDWFFIAFTALLFAFSVIFLPFILKSSAVFSKPIKHKALISFSADTLFLLLLIFTSCFNYYGNANTFFKCALPLTLFSLILPWTIMLVCRYLKINPLFKTSLILLVSGFFFFFINSVISFFVDGTAFHIMQINFHDWQNCFNGNFIALVCSVLLLASIIFSAGGIAISLIKEKKS